MTADQCPPKLGIDHQTRRRVIDQLTPKNLNMSSISEPAHLTISFDMRTCARCCCKLIFADLYIPSTSFTRPPARHQTLPCIRSSATLEIPSRYTRMASYSYPPPMGFLPRRHLQSRTQREMVHRARSPGPALLRPAGRCPDLS